MFARVLGDGDGVEFWSIDLWKIADIVENTQVIDLVEDEDFFLSFLWGGAVVEYCYCSKEE